MKKELCLISVLLCGMFFSANAAENLVGNPSFEEEGDLKDADDLIQKGFKVDPKHWAKDWIINVITTPCEVAIVEEAGAPDGKKFLRVKTSGGTHLFTQNYIPGKNPLKISFSAKGEALEGKKPGIRLTLYQYKLDGTWYGKNYSAGEYKPEEKWKVFSVDVPALGDDVMFKIAFELEGGCDIDNLKAEK